MIVVDDSIRIKKEKKLKNMWKDKPRLRKPVKKKTQKKNGQKNSYFIKKKIRMPINISKMLKLIASEILNKREWLKLILLY